MKKNYWTYVVGAILFVLIMGQVGKIMNNSQTHNSSTSIQISDSEIVSDIHVFTTSQDSDGITQAQFDQTFLNSLETYTRERISEKTNEYLASHGQPKTIMNIESQAVYVEAGDSKLAIIRLIIGDESNQAFIHGIIGNQLKRVSCIHSSSKQIPVTYGPCGDKIKEVFGVNLNENGNQ